MCRGRGYCLQVFTCKPGGLLAACRKGACMHACMHAAHESHGCESQACCLDMHCMHSAYRHCMDPQEHNSALLPCCVKGTIQPCQGVVRNSPTEGSTAAFSLRLVREVESTAGLQQGREMRSMLIYCSMCIASVHACWHGDAGSVGTCCCAKLSDAPSALRKREPARTSHLLGCTGCRGCKNGKQRDSDGKLGGSHGNCWLLNSCVGQCKGAWRGQEREMSGLGRNIYTFVATNATNALV